MWIKWICGRQSGVGRRGNVTATKQQNIEAFFITLPPPTPTPYPPPNFLASLIFVLIFWWRQKVVIHRACVMRQNVLTKSNSHDPHWISKAKRRAQNCAPYKNRLEVLTLDNPVLPLLTTTFKIKKDYAFSPVVYLCWFVRITQQTAITPLNKINRFIFIMDRRFVLFEVGT